MPKQVFAFLIFYSQILDIFITVYLVNKTEVLDNTTTQKLRRLMCLISLQALATLPHSCEMKYKEKQSNLPGFIHKKITIYTFKFVDYLGYRENISNMIN